MEEPALDFPTRRIISALDNIALALEELRLLKEYELGVRVKYDEGNTNIAAAPRKAEEE